MPYDIIIKMPNPEIIQREIRQIRPRDLILFISGVVSLSLLTSCIEPRPPHDSSPIGRNPTADVMQTPNAFATALSRNEEKLDQVQKERERLLSATPRPVTPTATPTSTLRPLLTGNYHPDRKSH